MKREFVPGHRPRETDEKFPPGPRVHKSQETLQNVAPGGNIAGSPHRIGKSP
jgi:hypothetical protein